MNVLLLVVKVWIFKIRKKFSEDEEIQDVKDGHSLDYQLLYRVSYGLSPLIIRDLVYLSNRRTDHYKASKIKNVNETRIQKQESKRYKL